MWSVLESCKIAPDILRFLRCVVRIFCKAMDFVANCFQMKFFRLKYIHTYEKWISSFARHFGIHWLIKDFKILSVYQKAMWKTKCLLDLNLVYPVDKGVFMWGWQIELPRLSVKHLSLQEFRYKKQHIACQS